MCGIIGQVSIAPLNTTQPHFEDAMSLMPHRGPDAKSTYRSAPGNVLFGHVRLSIQDPRPEGTQPMVLRREEGAIVLVFNGEIYNFIELKQELMTLGYAFVTQTDTEVLLCAYAAWGEQCVKRFNGMFAIALFDESKNKFILLRDRMGEKPLYYHVSNQGVLSFASEMKVLKRLIGHTPYNANSLDPVLLEQYMSFGYVPGELPLQEISPNPIRRLLPAHLLSWDLNADTAPSQALPYWLDKPGKIDTRAPQREVDLIGKTKSIIDESLRIRLRSDVPLGVFLSGGLDSSAIVAWLSEQTNTTIKTFSVRYDAQMFGEGYDESRYARQVANLFGTEHHEFTMTPQHFVDYLKTYIHLMDEPVTEAAAVSLHYVAELARKHVTVVLSGEGSDEVFAGYDLYRRMHAVEKVRSILTPFGATMLDRVAQKILPKGSKLAKYIHWASLPFESRYQGISTADPMYRNKTYRSDFKRVLSQHSAHHQTLDFLRDAMESTQGDSLLNRMLRFDRKTWLVDDLLIKADRMSMGSSLELRVPFLDHHLIEWSHELPDHLKIRGNCPKYILKKMVPTLPENIVNREKTGFPTPLQQMFKAGVLYEFMLKEFERHDCALWGILDRQEVFSLIKEHQLGQADHHRYLWQLLVLSLWIDANCSTLVPAGLEEVPC